MPGYQLLLPNRGYPLSACLVPAQQERLRLLMVALAAGQQHLPGCVASVLLPCGTANHYQLLGTDNIVVTVHHDLFGLTDGAFVGMANNQSVNALYGVAEALIAVDRCTGVNAAAGAMGNSHRIAGDRDISCYPAPNLQFEECYVLGVVVLHVQLAHDIAHNVLVGVLGRPRFVVTGYRAEYLILDGR